MREERRERGMDGVRTRNKGKEIRKDKSKEEKNAST